MKKKTCKYLDSTIWGTMQIMPKVIHPCCMSSAALYQDENLDVNKIDIDEYMQKRKDFAEKMNQGLVCNGCELIIEKDEECIDVGKISYLNLGLFTACNLRCKYCYYKKEHLSEKLDISKTYIVPFLKKLIEHDVLKDDIRLGLFGGEPLLYNDIAEALQCLKERYKHPSLSFLSNSTITSRAVKLAKELDKVKDFQKDLYTSVDAGTTKTYRELRGRDLYKDLTKNLVFYAKHNVFNRITLKYILLFDHTNTSDKDIMGFLLLFNKVMKHQKGEMVFAIDYDILSKDPISMDMIMAGGKLYYAMSKIFKVHISYEGTGMAPETTKGGECIRLLENYACLYEKMPKSLYEHTVLTYLKVSNSLNVLLKIFDKIIKLIKIMYFQ